MHKRRRLVLRGMLLLFLTAGCWDRIDIEERGFVLGTAIDLSKNEEEKEKIEVESPGKPKGKTRFILTNQMVIPGTIAEDNPGETYNVSASGNTLFECVREMAARTSQSPFYEHNKILILSEDVAKRGHIPSLLDLFLRDKEMKRSIQVLIAVGEARKALEVKPQNKEMPAMYINSVVNNTYKNLGMHPEVLVGDIHEYLLLDESFTLPRIMSDGDEIKMTGSAVFQGDAKRMIGFLSSEETEGLNIIKNQVEGGLFQVEIEGDLIVYEIKKLKTRISADVADPLRPKFHVTVLVQGNLGEKYAMIDPFDADVITNIEHKLAREIERIVNSTTEKLQKDFETDAMGLGTLLKRNHYKVWKRLEGDWDRGEKYFTRCEIEVTARVQIERRGTIIKSHGALGDM